jgi:hypothetical protein
MAKMSKWEQIKEIKGLLAGLVTAFTVVSVIGLALMDWRVQVHVRNELAKQDLATDSNIMALNAGVADNKRTGEENAEDIDQNRQRVEAAFQALIGRPTSDDN